MAKANMGRKGRITDIELRKIHGYREAGFTPDQIAERMERPLNLILNSLGKSVKGQSTILPSERPPPPPPPPPAVTAEETALLRQKQTLIQDLHAAPRWRQITRQFTTGELSVYETEYADWLIQLGEETTHTEKLQVHQAVVYRILQDRCLLEQRQLRDELEDLDKQRDRLSKLYSNPDLRAPEIIARFLALETRIRGIHDSMAAKSRQLNDLESKYQSLFEDLKATRNQRLERIEKPTMNFLDLVKLMMVDDKRADLGRQAELMRAATTRKADEMGRLHQYADGSYDHPLLNADTVDINEMVLDIGPSEASRLSDD